MMAKGMRIERELKKLIPCFLFSDRGYLGKNRIKYLQEGIGFPSSPSDTNPIHIFLKQELSNIVRSNTSTIKDPDLVLVLPVPLHLQPNKARTESDIWPSHQDQKF